MIKKTLLFVIILVHGALSFSLKDSRIKELQKIVYEKKIAKIEKILKKDNQEEKKYLLFFSVLSRNEGICSYLIENGLDVNQFDEYYNTPLLKACSVNENTEIVDLLLRKGASVKAKNTKFATPLIIASQIPNNIETVRLLLLANSDVNAKDINGETPLIKATKSNLLETVQLLIKNKADINLVDNNNNTALFYGIKNNSMEVVKELLAKGATISINGDKGDTLAELAGENDEILKLLKEHGYKPSPTELWNGFTDEMTKNQVIARADKLLNAKSKDDSLYSNTRGNRNELKFSNYTIKEEDLIIPEPVVSISYDSPNEEFRSDWFYRRLNMRGNVRFIFYENLLYSIEIEWNKDLIESVIEQAKKMYGCNYSIINSREGEVLYWNLKGKEFYLRRHFEDTIELFVLSKAIMKKYKADLLIRKQNERNIKEIQIQEKSKKIKL